MNRIKYIGISLLAMVAALLGLGTPAQADWSGDIDSRVGRDWVWYDNVYSTGGGWNTYIDVRVNTYDHNDHRHVYRWNVGYDQRFVYKLEDVVLWLEGYQQGERIVATQSEMYEGTYYSIPFVSPATFDCRNPCSARITGIVNEKYSVNSFFSIDIPSLNGND